MTDIGKPKRKIRIEPEKKPAPDQPDPRRSEPVPTTTPRPERLPVTPAN